MSFVVRDKTGFYRDELKQLGGRWNTNLIGGSGWLFNKKRHEMAVKNWMTDKSNTCMSIVTTVCLTVGFFSIGSIAYWWC